MRNYENLFLRYINGLNNFKLSKKEKIKKLTSLNYYLEFLLDQKNISDSEYKKLRQTISKTVYELKYISFQRFLIDLRTRYKTVYCKQSFCLISWWVILNNSR
ncbi:MAG: hypothetical protein KatS3mg090_0642 [Patescibacteria group bacterium]|nr:MAG: hypothetical protein KatS3mg090_0642 [Patescibacteria group bacterium]